MTNPEPFYPFEDLITGMTAETLEAFKTHVRSILEAPDLLIDQQYDALHDAAYKTLPYPQVSPEAQRALEEGVICLLAEGPAPFHPRYVTPDYAHLLTFGSEFLDLKPAGNLYDATASLLTAYRYVPNGLLVFIGRLDELLDRYVEGAARRAGVCAATLVLVAGGSFIPKCFCACQPGSARYNRRANAAANRP